MTRFDSIALLGRDRHGIDPMSRFGILKMASESWSETDASSWAMAVEGVAIATYAAKQSDEARLLMTLNALLCAAPCRDLVTGLDPVSNESMSAQLGAGAGAAAALGMLGAKSGYMLSRGANGLHIASVILPESHEDASASGASVGIALVGAIALAIVGREHDRLKGRAQIDTFG